MSDQPLELLLDALANRIVDELENRQHKPGAGETAGSLWMNVNSTATYLDWPRQRLYKLTAQGAIPHYKHDGRLLFHRQELDQWLAAHRQPGGDWMNTQNRAISP